MTPLKNHLTNRMPTGPLGFCLLLVLILTACGQDQKAAENETLTVFAAASCADWVTDLDNISGAPDLKLQLGPSSGLARQIADGAPADVFITAHKRWIEHLMEAGKVKGKPTSFASNSLVCVALKSTTFKQHTPDSLGTLALALKPDDRIAIADESVPAGDYTRQALKSAQLLQTLKPHLVGQDDARSTLRAVTQGQAKVGFVYASDAHFDGLAVLFTLDPNSHDPIQYWACAIRGSNESASQEFQHSLSSQAVQELLNRNGFQPAY